MLTACIVMAPPSGALLSRLQAVADLLVAANLQWLREQTSAGRAPPCCTLHAAPPWTRGGALSYVGYHGAPLGSSRVYLDAPSLLEHGVGTCIDLAAFDAAARELAGVPARAIVLPTGPRSFHCVCRTATGDLDSAALLAARK